MMMMMMMSVEQSVEWELAGETEVLGENLPQCHFVHHNLTWPDLGSNPSRHGGKPPNSRLRYGTALDVSSTQDRRMNDNSHVNLKTQIYSVTIVVLGSCGATCSPAR
jgi:hypothetical protein